MKKYHNNNLNNNTVILIIIIIEGLSLLQSIPLTTASKQMQAQKKGGAGLESCLELMLKATS